MLPVTGGQAKPLLGGLPPQAAAPHPGVNPLLQAVAQAQHQSLIQQLLQQIAGHRPIRPEPMPMVEPGQTSENPAAAFAHGNFFEPAHPVSQLLQALHALHGPPADEQVIGMRALAQGRTPHLESNSSRAAHAARNRAAAARFSRAQDY